ncbi:MAG: hypothetical protein ABTQ29_02620 [Siculibacillus sp.]
MSFIRTMARAVLPKAVRQGIHARYHAAVVRRLPDRVFMESRIFPWLEAQKPRRVLFVGVRAYTEHYPRLLAERGMHVWTVDIDPDAARWGAADHLTRDVCALVPADFPEPFDAVVFNGVIGWGVDEPEPILAALGALRSLVPDGAPMVIGWNDDRSRDPLALAGVSEQWESIAGPSGTTRRAFEGVTHVYDFVRARPRPSLGN